MKKIILILIFTITSFLGFSQTWNTINLSTTEDLNKIYFINDNVGFVIGDKGLVFRTADSGVTWSKITTGVTHNLRTIAFLDASTGYINGLKTTDGGLTWTKLSSTNDYGVFLLFASNSIFSGNGGNNFKGEIHKSIDGGTTWSVDSDPANTALYTDYFHSGNTGYLVTWYSGHIIKTTDAGATWTRILDATSTLIDDLYGVDFDKNNLNLGVIVGNNRSSEFIKTTDAGVTWTSISPLKTSDNFNGRDVKIIDNNNYIVVGSTSVSSKNIYKTIDGGTTWTSETASNNLKSVDCIKTNQCFAIGEEGTLLSKVVILSVDSNQLMANNIKLYPNPAKEFVFIDGAKNLENATLFDVLGKKIRSFSIKESKFYVGDLQKGMYLLKLNNQRGLKKIVVE